MPTYEYRCEKCGPFEQWQSIKEDALTACPKCGAKVERLISSGVGLILGGTGASSGGSSHAHSSGCGCCSERGGCPGAAE